MLQQKHINTRIYSRKNLVIAGIIMLVLIIVTMTWSVYYHATYKNKLPSNLSVASIDLGGLTTEEAAQELESRLASITLTISDKDTSVNLAATELGVGVDGQQLSSWRHKPGLNVPLHTLRTSDMPAPLKIDTEQFAAKLASITTKKGYFKPQAATFHVKGAELVITDEKPGHGIDVATLEANILSMLSQSLQDYNIDVSAGDLQAGITADVLHSLLPELTDRLSQTYSLKSGDNTIRLSTTQLAGLFAPVIQADAATLTVSESAVRSVVEDIAKAQNQDPVTQIKQTYKSGRAATITTKGVKGAKVTNSNKLAEELFEALVHKKPYQGTFTFTTTDFTEKTVVIDDTLRTITYDITSWGSVTSDFASFKSYVNQTLNDERGWAAAGLRFVQVASGGSFTVVLSEPARVQAASPTVCDSYYSCRVGRYVIINDDRWKGATPVWTGSLRDYRHMVVNHETGHWFGRGHAFCGGAGQKAPVMQQQSISLQGCAFNPWPLSWEVAAIR